MAKKVKQETLEIYDQVPYGDEPFSNTHPQSLASIATFCGLSPACPENCRLLELGAAKGSNIIGMAHSLPNSQFVGVDLSKKQVEIGNENIKDLNLKNISLKHDNIMDIGKKYGQFDYIISHGILSWVPPEVRSHMFEICGTLLKPNGVCYFSYNTYPGWKTRDIFRDIMFFEAGDYNSPKELADRGRNAVARISELLSDNNSPFANHLKEELKFYIDRPDWYYLHDFVADNNQPFYISQIFEFAEKVGLQYLTDTELSSSTLGGLSKKNQNILNSLRDDPKRFEQYSDIARLRSFRRSLFCKKGTEISSSLKTDTIRKLYLAAPIEASQPMIEENPGLYRFTHANGGAIQVSDLRVIQALRKISSNWPKAVSVSQLESEIRANGGNDAQVMVVLDGLVSGVFANILELRTSPGIVTNKIEGKPKASSLAQFQAKTSNVVTSILHHAVQLEEFERRVIAFLDGKTTAPEIIAEIFKDTEIKSKHLAAYNNCLKKLMLSGLLVE